MTVIEGSTRTVGPIASPAVEVGPPVPSVGVGWLLALMAANTVAAVGLLADIARHVTLAGTVADDDFLSTWHFVLYGGVAGAAVVLGGRAVARGPAALRDLRCAVAGVALLTLGGIVDALWHEAFGVEAAFEALVSPPHLLILAGLVLLMAAPIGALARGPSPRLGVAQSVVLAMSVTSLLVVVSLFTGHLSPLVGGSEVLAGSWIEPVIGTSADDYNVVRALGAALWFSGLASATVAVVEARLTPVFGTWSLAFGLLGLAPLVVTGSTMLPITAGLVVFGLACDLAALRGRPHPLAMGAATAVLWAVAFAVLRSRRELVWERALWSGVITSGALVGVAVCATVRWVAAPRVVDR